MRFVSASDLVVEPTPWGEEEFERLRSDKSWNGELELRRKDGSTVPVEAHATSIVIPGQDPVYVAMIRDVSERRALERMQRDFTAMISHDLKGPLTSLRAYAQLMQRRGAYNEEAINTIIAQTDRMERLINDLLDVAQIEAGQLELRLSQFELARLVDDAVAAMKPVAHNHPIFVQAPDEPIVGRWDADRIGQVLQNLITNAVKYSPEGSPIRVRIERDAAVARLSVADEGPGIPPESLPKLFLRFYRADGSAGKAPGLGLGLYISRLLVEAHGGRIDVASQLGQGSTFFIELPLGPDPRLHTPVQEVAQSTPVLTPN